MNKPDRSNPATSPALWIALGVVFVAVGVVLFLTLS
jgi:hypothetical protein